VVESGPSVTFGDLTRVGLTLLIYAAIVGGGGTVAAVVSFWLIRLWVVMS